MGGVSFQRLVVLPVLVVVDPVLVHVAVEFVPMVMVMKMVRPRC